MARYQPPKPPAAPPASAEAGAAQVRQFMLKLFARQDGEAVDWRMMAETLFRAAFDALDKLPVDDRRSVARRVHEGSYSRMADDQAEGDSTSKTDPVGSVPAPTNALFKSTAPRPPKVEH